MKRLALPTWIRGRSKTGRATTASDGKPLGRNDPCPCGSGKKFKQCCWGKVRVEGSRWSRKAVLLVFLAGAVITLAGLNLRRELGGGEPSRRGPTTAPATIPLGTPSGHDAGAVAVRRGQQPALGPRPWPLAFRAPADRRHPGCEHAAACDDPAGFNTCTLGVRRGQQPALGPRPRPLAFRAPAAGPMITIVLPTENRNHQRNFPTIHRPSQAHCAAVGRPYTLVVGGRHREI